MNRILKPVIAFLVGLCLSSAAWGQTVSSATPQSAFTSNRVAKTWALFGDSVVSGADTGNLTNNPCGPSNTQSTIICTASLPASYGTWINLFTGYAAYRTPGYNCGISGGTAVQLLAQVGCVLALQPDFVVMDAGENNDVGGISCAAHTATVRQIYNAFLNAGIAVFKVGTFPRSSPFTFTTAQANTAQCYNQEDAYFASEAGSRGFYFVPIDSVAVDPTTTGSWASPSGCLLDGAHPAQTCAKAWAQLVANQINTVIPQWRAPMFSNGDVYDATNNPYGNLLPNGLLAGTGGGLTNCTGTVPANTSLLTGGLGGAACAGTVSTGSDGRPIATVTLSGTGTIACCAAIFYAQQATSLSNFNIGDTIQACGYIQMGANVGLIDAQILLHTTESGTGYTYKSADGAGTSFPTAGYGSNYLLQCTPPRTLTAVPTQVEVDAEIDMQALSSTTISGAMNVQSLSLRKIGP